MLFETLLLVVAGSVCPSDVAGDGSAFPDGVIDSNDLLACINAWGTDDQQTDVDGDGVVGVGDLLLQLKQWGACQYADDALTYTFAKVWDQSDDDSFVASTLGASLALSGSLSQYMVECDGNQSYGELMFVYGTASDTFPNARIQFNTVEVTDLSINIFLSMASSPQNSYLLLNEITSNGDIAIESWCIGSCNSGQNSVSGLVEALPPGLYYLYFSGTIEAGPAGMVVGLQWWFQ
jgi:hypothetical protein